MAESLNTSNATGMVANQMMMGDITMIVTAPENADSLATSMQSGRRPLKVHFGYTVLSDLFIGRENILQDLQSSLSQQGSQPGGNTGTVIAGSRGSGKTSVVKELISIVGSQYTNIIFIPASNPATIQAAFTQLANDKLKMKTKNLAGQDIDFKVLLSDIYDTLSSPACAPRGGTTEMERRQNQTEGRKTIVIFDDAQSMRGLFAYLPTTPEADTRPSILVTSRNKDPLEWPGMHILKLGRFTESETLNFLNDSIPDKLKANLQSVQEVPQLYPRDLAEIVEGIRNNDMSVFFRVQNRLLDEWIQRMDAGHNSKMATRLFTLTRNLLMVEFGDTRLPNKFMRFSYDKDQELGRINWFRVQEKRLEEGRQEMEFGEEHRGDLKFRNDYMAFSHCLNALQMAAHRKGNESDESRVLKLLKLLAFGVKLEVNGVAVGESGDGIHLVCNDNVAQLGANFGMVRSSDQNVVSLKVQSQSLILFVMADGLRQDNLEEVTMMATTALEMDVSEERHVVLLAQFVTQEEGLEGAKRELRELALLKHQHDNYVSMGGENGNENAVNWSTLTAKDEAAAAVSSNDKPLLTPVIATTSRASRHDRDMAASSFATSSNAKGHVSGVGHGQNQKKTQTKEAATGSQEATEQNNIPEGPMRKVVAVAAKEDDPIQIQQQILRTLTSISSSLEELVKIKKMKYRYDPNLPMDMQR